MDPSKFTEKTSSVVNKARELALDSSQQALGALHVAVVLFEDAEGVAKQAVLKLGGEEAYRSALRVLNRAQQAQPRVDPAPDEVFLDSSLKKAFTTAAKLQKEKGDSFLGEEGWEEEREREGERPARAPAAPSRNNLGNQRRRRRKNLTATAAAAPAAQAWTCCCWRSWRPRTCPAPSRRRASPRRSSWARWRPPAAAAAPPWTPPPPTPSSRRWQSTGWTSPREAPPWTR